jgi:hypothetical protein
MWHLLVLNFVFDLYPVVVKSAWVEIPQLPDKKPPQFVFGNANPAREIKLNSTFQEPRK